MRAIQKFTDERWVLLYVERWLKAPVRTQDGTLHARTVGTPQGGVVGPVLANVFLHLALDTWLAERHPGTPFERYADDMSALSDRAGSKASLTLDRATAAPVSTRTPSPEDKDRLLQGLESAG